MSTHGPTKHPREGEVELPVRVSVSRDFIRRLDILDSRVAGLTVDRERLSREIAALRKQLAELSQ
jgi:hypothetical protein